MLTFLLAVFGTSGLTQLYKNTQAKYGDTKIHIAMAVIAIAASIVVIFFGQTHTFKAIVEYAGAIFATAITFYQVIFKQVGNMSNPQI